MSDDKKSAEMSQDELYAQHFQCPDCGRQGVEGGQVAVKNFEITIIEGLDLANCEGCVAVLAARGGSPVGKVPSEDV
jgi:transcription elongation factor Elf1